MDTILVTGGAGFIGSCLVRQLVAAGDWHVVTLDLLTYAASQRTLDEVAGSPRHTFVQGDIADTQLVGKLLAQHRPRAIVHLAAESHVDRSIDGPRKFVETNIVGTFALVDATLRYWQSLTRDDREQFRFVHVSTDEVFGALGGVGTFDETSPYRPNSPYAASKAASDHLVRSYHQTYGLPTILTNSSNNYGPYQHPEKLVPLMALNALDGRALPVYGSGQQVRDWLHVSDHTAALELIVRRGEIGETYCIGGDCERTNLEMIEAIADIADELRGRKANASRERIEHVADRPGHDWRYALDASKLQRELCWLPRVQLEDGLRETVAWYAEHRGWVEEVSRGFDRDQRLGLGSYSK